MTRLHGEHAPHAYEQSGKLDPVGYISISTPPFSFISFFTINNKKIKKKSKDIQVFKKVVLSQKYVCNYQITLLVLKYDLYDVRKLFQIKEMF